MDRDRHYRHPFFPPAPSFLLPGLSFLLPARSFLIPDLTRDLLLRLQGPSTTRWRRCMGLLAQVPRWFGAGVEKGVGPAPQERVEARFTAQVPTPKPHLRQQVATPAPNSADTHAKEWQHLRQMAQPNIRSANQINVPLRPLKGTLRCAAGPNRLAAQPNMPQDRAECRSRCAAIFGLGRVKRCG